jgi:hypothetical protein
MDPYKDLLGIDLPPERLQEILDAYRNIVEEIHRLRTLDLTQVHPAIVFEPTASYRLDKKT